MKKIFLSTGAFLGLALSSLALASCGGETELKVTDLDGKEVSIAATEDADAVSKALVLSSKNTLSKNQEKLYAIEVAAALNGDFSFDSGVVKASTEVSGTARVGVSIGKNPYTALDKTKAPTDEEIKKAHEELMNNFNLLIDAKGSLKFKSIEVNEESVSSEALEKVKESYKKAEGKSATASARAFMYEGYGYTELNAEEPKEIAVSLATGEPYKDAVTEYHKNEKSKLSMSLIEATVTTLFADYQSMTLSEFVEKDGEWVTGYLSSMGIVLSPRNVDSLFNSKIDATFYESDTYKTLKMVVETLGVSVSKVENGNVTFAVDVNENEIPTLVKKLGVAKSLGISNLDSILDLVYSTENSLLKLSVTLNAKTGRLSNVTLTFDNLARISSILAGVKSFIPYSIQKYIPEGFGGKVNFTFDVKYNDDVKLDAKPNASLTYEELALLK